MNSVHAPAIPDNRRIPVELCEHIIDTLYFDQVGHRVLGNINADLGRCALVCRAWRVRSQRRLFNYVVISNPVALEKLSAALEVGIHLRDYVHKITLVESSDYTTNSVVSLFSVALQRKLP